MADPILKRVMRKARAIAGKPGIKEGEIKDDSFYYALARYAAKPDIKTMLEIGASTGDGSTQALLEGMRKNPSNPKLYCIEVLTDRFVELEKRVAGTNTKCYNVASVPIEQNASEQLIRDFAAAGIQSPPVEMSMGWRTKEVDYVTKHNIDTNGIARIKRENNIDVFDLVLIDGSEFAGKAELDATYGAKYIFMDDIRVMKNHHNLVRLLYDPKYKFAEADLTLRQGFAVFERVD